MKIVSVAVASFALSVACGDVPLEQRGYESGRPVRQSSAIKEEGAHVFRAHFARASDDWILERAVVMAHALGSPVDATNVAAHLTNHDDGDRVSFDIGEAGDVHVRVSRAYGDMSVTLSDRLVRQRGSNDASVSDVRSRAKAIVAELAHAGIVNRSDYSVAPKEVQVLTGRGYGEDIVDEVVSGYVFTFMREINSIPFPNAGIKIGVTSKGVVRKIRVGGALVESRRDVDGREVPIEGAGTVVADVPDDVALDRFRVDHPGAKVFQSYRAYVFDELQQSIEPKLYVAYSDTFDAGEGSVGMTRRNAVSYPLRVGGKIVEYPAGPPAVGTVGGDVK